MTHFGKTLAASLVLASSVLAHAQNPTFCGGLLTADSFYSTVSLNARQSNVEYFVQLRNTSNVARQATVTFPFQKEGHFISRRVSGTQSFPPYGSVRVSLAVDTLNSPTGAGKLADAELKNYVHITCANVR